MELFEQIIKALGLVIGALVPAVNLLTGRYAQRPKHLQERYQAIKGFFDDGGVDRHPMLVEACFAAALGHAKLNAHEIALLVRQTKPMQFMAVYLRARDYMRPSDDGQRFMLNGWFAHKALRRGWILTGVLVYAILVAGALALLLYELPTLVSARAWSHLYALLMLAVAALCIGALALNGAAKVSFAERLVSRQVMLTASSGAGHLASAPVAPTVPPDSRLEPAPDVAA